MLTLSVPNEMKLCSVHLIIHPHLYYVMNT